MFVMSDEREVEIIQLDEKCSIEFDRKGNVKIGKNCENKKLSPAELHFLAVVNDAVGNR